MFEAGLVDDGVIPRWIVEVAELWRIRDSMSELHRFIGPPLLFDLAVPIC